jgi:transglutaminase-like putative cysteine protease
MTVAGATKARTARPTVGFTVINVLLLWIATGIASIALWPIYQNVSLIIMVAGAVVLGTIIAVAAAVFRWAAPIVLGATVVVFIAFGVPLAVPGESVSGVLPSGTGLQDLVSGVALGWKQLLTISLPVGQYQALLVPFYALILVLTVIALSFALRSRFGDVAALGPVILFVTAIAFGAETAMWPVPATLALLAVLLLWVVWRRWHKRRAAIKLLANQVSADRAGSIEIAADTRFVGLRTLFAAIVILALAGGTAVAASAALPPTGTRDVLRTVTTQPFEPRNYASPLSGFRTYWKTPKTNDVMFTVQGLPAGSRIRIATLDTYDGVVYSVGSAAVSTASGSFTRVPFEYNQSGVKGTRATVTVHDQSYSGVWVPTVGDLEKVSFSGGNASALRASFFYNNTTGTAADLSRLTAGESYTLTAVVPKQPTLDQLTRVEPGTASVPDLTVVPAELTSTLNTYVAKANTQGERLVAMIKALQANGYVSHGIGKEPASRSGHAVDRINELFTDQLMIGDAEQYSVAAALMARELGFPARVVMGFVPETTGSGTSEIKGDDVSAWIEVDTAQYGWVTIDPNPPTRAIPVIPPKDPNQVARPQTVVPPPATVPNPADPAPVPDAKQHSAAAPNAFLAALLTAAVIGGWVLLGILVLLSPFIVILALKGRRRRKRRRAPTPIEQIRGGWQEFEDRVLDHGFETPVAATRSEVASAVGGTRPAVLAAVADRATFGPEVPEEDEANLVWRAVTELTSALDAGKTRWERLKYRVSLRSLRGPGAQGYSVGYLFKPKGSS